MRGRGLKTAALVLALCAAGATGAGTAAAHEETYPTTLKSLSAGWGEATYNAMGYVESPRAGCVRDRLVRGLVGQPGSWTVFDRDTTSRNGAWFLSQDAGPQPGNMLARAARKRIGPKTDEHSHVCTDATLQLSPTEAPDE